MKSARYLYSIAITSASLCFAWIAFAANEKASDNQPVMFVQTAPGVSFKDGKLTLMSPSTIFFSDRPARLAGHMPCKNFIRAWSEGDDSFKKDPPNAVLTAFVPNAAPTKMVVKLQNPRFEGPNLMYDASIIKGSAPEGMYEAALFIDDARIRTGFYGNEELSSGGPFHADILPNGTITGPLGPSRPD